MKIYATVTSADACCACTPSFSYMFQLKLSDAHGLSLPFIRSALQRAFFKTSAALFAVCCCYWAFQPSAVFSHRIPQRLWWWHWCGLLLFGNSLVGFLGGVYHKQIMHNQWQMGVKHVAAPDWELYCWLFSELLCSWLKDKSSGILHFYSSEQALKKKLTNN